MSMKISGRDDEGMTKQLVNAFLSNKIYLAKINKDGMMSDTGREDFTDNAIRSVIGHMKTEFERAQSKEPNRETFSYAMDGIGKITFTPDRSESNE